VKATKNAFTILMQYVHSVNCTLSSSEPLQNRKNLSLKPLWITAAKGTNINFNVALLLAAFASHQNCLLIYFKQLTLYQIQYPEMKDTTNVFLMYMELIPLRSFKNQGRHYHFHQI